MVFLMETKCSKKRVMEVCSKLKFDSCLVVESSRSSGGLVLMWKSHVKVVIYNYLRWHINAHVTTDPEAPTWLLTGFYGHPETSKRNWSWEFLKAIKLVASTPWLCCGDFNEITCQGEEEGGCPRPYTQMEIFRVPLNVAH
ncbi:hypothetical protein CIPAW_15G092800 [Carya illinoinensis]|uniref:Endonuclease/exonuclease/phosphatase domain-containing protein n=1 Tax=Carya illinoinensis TaxID=32201 RepID=A0A8T1NBS8_CARIL|nr:hypothetical protein CIPAW_15G092800 [Carya illinoinensis]